MIIDHCRDIEELKKLYESRPMDDGQYTFEHILNNPNLFCFYSETDNTLKGFIFITQDKEKRLFLSGVSVRKNMPDNIQAIIAVCNAFGTDIYSDTDKKEAQLILKKAGFKEIEQNLYKKRYKNE
nr:MAG TPA: acetyltransferase [Caudoviricetes sp.]